MLRFGPFPRRSCARLAVSRPMLWRDFYSATDLASAISVIVMLAGSICFFLLPGSQFSTSGRPIIVGAG